MNGKKVLITGGTGYIGSDLVEKLLSSSDVEISLVVRDIVQAKELFLDKVGYILYSDLPLFKSQIEDFSPDIVVHLAAYSTSSDEPEEIDRLLKSNIIFTSDLLIALSSSNIKLFINTGSFSEYHNNDTRLSPTYFYSATKTSARYMIEYYAKRDDFKLINAILFSVYGKKSINKKIIDYAVESLESEQSVKMSDGYQSLDFVHIDDVVNLYCKLIINQSVLKNSQIDYQVGTGKSSSIRDLVKVLESITDKKANIEWGAYKSRKLDTKRACADVTLLHEELEYKSIISLYDGLSRYLKSENK